MMSAPIERAPDRADAADEAGAAEDDGGDGVELVGLSELQAVRGEEARGRHDAAEARRQPREGVDEEQDRPDLDAGEPRRIRVAADRVDVNAEHRPPENEPGDQHDREGDPDQPGQAEQGAVADEGEGQLRIELGRVAAEQAREAAHGGQAIPG